MTGFSLLSPHGRQVIEGRLIKLESFDGPQNMALDQTLLELAADSSASEPTLRFYSWSVPTLSLGYFQAVTDREQHSSSSKLNVVRRSTGGGAIVHDRELTYSLMVPLRSQAAVLGRTSPLGAVAELYELMHLAIIDALRDFGCRADLHGREAAPASGQPSASKNQPSESFLCFQRRSEWDVVLGGYKVLGSAQRRYRGSVLQHGSVLLEASPHAPELPGVCNLSSRAVDPEQLAGALAETLLQQIGVRWIQGDLKSGERISAQRIANERFKSPHWTARR